MTVPELFDALEIIDIKNAIQKDAQDNQPKT